MDILAFAYMKPGSLYLTGNQFLCPLPNALSIVQSTCIQTRAFSVSPTLFVNNGGETTIITGANFSSQLSYTCMFGNSPSSTTTVLNSNTISCISSGGTKGISNITLWVGSTQVTSPLTIQYTISCGEGSYVPNGDGDSCVTCPSGAYCAGGKEQPVAQVRKNFFLHKYTLFLMIRYDMGYVYVCHF